MPLGELIGKYQIEATPSPQEFVRPVPFSSVIMGVLSSRQAEENCFQLSLQEAIERGIGQNPQFSLSWLAVQEQRKMDNAVLEVYPEADASSVLLPPSALEGYLYGLPPEQIITTLAEMGVDTLDGCTRLHRSNFGFASRLMQALTDNQLRRGKDTELLEEADTLLGTLLARLRARLLSNPKALRYRDATRSAVARVLPHFASRVDNLFQLVDSYKLPYVQREPGVTHPLKYTWNPLNSRQQAGWQFLEKVGKVGHPLLRIARPYVLENSRARHIHQ